METNKNLRSGDDGSKGPQPLPGEQKQTPAPEIPKMPSKEVEQMPVAPQTPREQGKQEDAA